MKRVLFTFLAVAILMATMITYASADGNSNIYTYEKDGIEYTVEFENSNVSSDEQQIIAEKLLGIREDGDAHTYGWMCKLFGHNLSTETVTVKTHKVRATTPRCLRSIYDVTSCSRCDYFVQELYSQVNIDCCPED